MHEIFISYRRVDTEPSGGHIHADLRRAFGDDCVFMDVRRHGIAWGADWDQSLRDALQQCAAMIVLIGPLWGTCERTPGVRRIDVPDDWVRNEIVTALRRQGVLVLPVLFQGAHPQQAEALPAELRELGFHKKQAYEITEANWDTDVARLVESLVTIPRLKQLHDLTTTETGIRRLQELIRSRSDVADAVIRSRAVIETTDREVDEIRLLKGIHDALHEIEAKCLIPMASSTTPLDGIRRKFVQKDQAIRALSAELATVVPELPTLLGIDLPRQLTAVAEGLEQAVNVHGADNRDRAVDEFEGLIGQFPRRLNDAIDAAATRVELRQLAELMKSVGDLLRPQAAGDWELKPLFDGIGALDGLREGLARRIREHGLLQSLNDFLRQAVTGQRRVGTAGRIAASTLVADWNTVRRLRNRFRPPFSPEVEDGLRVLEVLEPGIDAAVKSSDEPKAAGLLNDYFNEVGDLFRVVNTRLKEFCFGLREKTRALKVILEICSIPSHHG